MSLSTLATIDKLKGRENYDSWKFAVQCYLELEGLWTCISTDNIDSTKDTPARSRIAISGSD